MDLGPITQVDGVQVREVLNDFSYRPEWDRPPKYLIADDSTRPHRTPIDRSETREPITHRLPGRPISELKGIHSGKVAILFNGESMGKLDLWKIREAGIPMIGLNRTHQGYPTYTGPQPEYLCIVDTDWFEKPAWKEAVRAHPGIINGSVHKEPIGYRATRHPRMSPFSFDLDRDGYFGPIPCTTGHLALQVAAYMGFTELYCLGFDLGGNHFDGTSGSRNYGLAYAHHKKQAPLLKEHGINLWLCESPDSRLKDVFGHKTFGELLG